MMDVELISRQYNFETAFVVLLLRVKMGISSVKDLNEFIENKSINTDFVLQLTKEHDLNSFIFSSKELREFSFLGNINDALLQNVELRARNNLLILAEMLQLNEKFRSASIAVIFYKGILLSKYFFNDFTTRATSDIDILIDSSDFITMREALLDSGFEEVYYYPEEYPEYFLTHSRESTFKKKIRGDQYLYIEVQWSLLPKFYGLPYDNHYFFENMTEFKIVDSNIPTLNTTQHLLALFIHHGLSDLWRSLKHVFDIALYIDRFNSDINWIEFYKKSEEWHAIENFNCGLNLVNILFGITPIQSSPWHCNQNRTAISLKSLLSYPLLGKRKKNIKNFRRQLLLCDTRYSKIGLLKGYLKLAIWPSIIDLQNHHFPNSLFPLYFITKRFRFLYKRK